MFQPSNKSTVVIPFLQGPEDELGIRVNDAYFGKVPEGRLKVGNNVAFFSGDGQCRSKIGISPRRAKPYLGSWDAQNGILTLVKYTLPGKPGMYVNSMWEIQKGTLSPGMWSTVTTTALRRRAKNPRAPSSSWKHPPLRQLWLRAKNARICTAPYTSRVTILRWIRSRKKSWGLPWMR